MGYFVVSRRANGVAIQIDGQHRGAALRIIGFADDDTVPCEVYEGLTERQEAELFDERNHVKTIAAMAKFKVRVAAGHRAEEEIDDCVRAQGLRIGRRVDKGISAVKALQRVHRAAGTAGLGKALRIIRDAYGDAGFGAMVIDGVGLLVRRYGDDLDEDRAVNTLSAANGGLSGLLTRAALLRAKMGQQQAECIAAAASEFYNRSGGKKLAVWWKD